MTNMSTDRKMFAHIEGRSFHSPVVNRQDPRVDKIYSFVEEQMAANVTKIFFDIECIIFKYK